MKKNQFLLEPFADQEEFINDTHKYAAFIGGRGSGKSEAGAIKLLRFVTQYPGSLTMVVAPTFRTLWDSTLRSIQKVFPPQIFKLYEHKKSIMLENGAEILLRSADDPDSLRGANLAGAWCDEAGQMKPDAWRILVPCLRQSGGYPLTIWVTGTPRGFNWLYQEFAVRAEEKHPDYWMKVVSARKNPYLPDDFIAQLEETYKNDPEFKLQEIEGGFTVVGGRAFFDLNTLLSMKKDVLTPLETREGCIEIFKPPVVAKKYVAGVDPCWGETNSWAVAQILDWQTGEQVAKIRGRIPLEEMADLFTKLCREYNDAYAGAEVNSEGKHLVDKMIELDYGNRMYHRDDDWYFKEDKRGWLTYDKTRPVILSELDEAIRNRSVVINSENTISELMSFIRNDKGKAVPVEGAYADEIMSLAIAWKMREYAVFGERRKLKVGHY
jgi:hypothetical protein